MTDDERKAVELFKKAVAILKKIPPEFTLYVASDTLCLMEGDSHGYDGRPRQHAVITFENGLRISGGDW